MVIVIADIHANLEALNAIIEDAENRCEVSGYGFLGDMFSYGPDPVACFDRIMGLDSIFMIAGSYEDNLINKDHLLQTPALSLPASSPAYLTIRDSVRWMCEQLGEERTRILAGQVVFDHTQSFGEKRHYFCHGSHKSNLEQFTDATIHEAFATTEAHVIWSGHIHLQFVREYAEGLHVNPGGAGLPFDGDTRAPYGVIDDSGTPQLHRVHYPVDSVVAKLASSSNPYREIGLHCYTTARLSQR